MFVNSHPTLDVSYELAKGDYTAGSPVLLKVTLARDVDEDEEDCNQFVVTPFYPSKKLANWWVVLGDRDSRQLYVIKKVTVTKSLVVKLELTKGTHRPRLYVICDSYVGADHDIELLSIEVAKGEGSDSDEDMDGDEDDE